MRVPEYTDPDISVPVYIDPDILNSEYTDPDIPDHVSPTRSSHEWVHMSDPE